jgi:molybdopterin synthase catalytic subunit
MAGCAEIEMEIEDSQTLGTLAGLLAERYPRLGVSTGIRLAVNRTFVALDHPVRNGDEIGVIPPVSGGAPDACVRLVRETIDVDALMQQAGAAGCGAIATFSGLVRPETSGEKSLTALDYESYEEMAHSQLAEIRGRAIAKFGLIEAIVVHRLGTVPLGETSIAVIVSSAHRAEAFEACRYIVDAVKADAPIWKKDVWSDGSRNWVDPTCS